MTKQSLPAVSILTSNTTFSTAAEGLRDDYLFGATSDADLAKAAGVKQPAIVLYKDFDDKETKFEEKFDSEAITTFAKTASTPLVGEVGPDTYAGYMAVRIAPKLLTRYFTDT
jgi:protein disulfide-isomerase A1